MSLGHRELGEMSLGHIKQYQAMLYAVWLGCRFEGEALLRFERLQRVYCGRFPRFKPLRREVYAA